MMLTCLVLGLLAGGMLVIGISFVSFWKSFFPAKSARRIGGSWGRSYLCVMNRPRGATADTVIALLRERSPDRFCGGCLALALGASLIEMRETLLRLVSGGRLRMR